MAIQHVDATNDEQKKSPAYGRPTKYKSEYCYDIINWFSQPTTREIVETVQGSNWTKETVRTEPVFFPTLQGYAAKLSVAESTVYLWMEQHKEFSEAVSRAKAIQAHALLNNAMIRQYDGRFAQLFAMNNMGMKTKQENELTGTAGGPIAFIDMSASGATSTDNS